jgi:hypothetical protein
MFEKGLHIGFRVCQSEWKYVCIQAWVISSGVTLSVFESLLR